MSGWDHQGVWWLSRVSEDVFVGGRHRWDMCNSAEAGKDVEKKERMQMGNECHRI